MKVLSSRIRIGGLALATIVGIGSALASLSTSNAASRTAGWTRPDLRPVNQPASVDGRFVFYSAAAGRLDVTALDAKTGRTVWSHLASTSGNAPGESPTLAVAGGVVLYLEPKGKRAAVAAADARTGKVLWQSVTADFSSWPEICPGESDAVCLTGEGAVPRFRVSDGHVLSAIAFSSPNLGGRSVGPGLYDPGLRKPEWLEASTGATLTWHKQLSAIFTAPGASTDYGWNFDRYAADGLFVGSVGWPPIAQTKTKMTADLSRSMTAGFRIDNGRPVWRDAGSMYVCSYLPCVGEPNPSVSRSSASAAPQQGLRLRMTGRVVYTFNSVGATNVTGPADVRLEGFDPRTGKTSWTFDAGRNVGLIEELLLPPQVGAFDLAIRSKSGELVDLSLVNGAERPVRRGTVGWCRRVVTYNLKAGYSGGGRTTHQYIGDYGLEPCTASGAATASPARVPLYLAQLGAESGGIVAWSDRSGVTARPVAS